MSQDSFQDDLFDSLLTDFLDESGQLLDRLDEDLLKLDEMVASLEADAGSADGELLNTIFRSAHSLKGLSAMLGLTNINQLTHRLENVIDAVRKNEMPLTRPMMETTFRAHDALKAMIAQLRAGGDDALEMGQLLEDIDGLLNLMGSARQIGTQQEAEQALQALLDNAGNAATSQPTSNEVPAPSNSQLALAAEMDTLFADAVDEDEVPAKYVAIFIDETDLSLDEIFELLYNETALAEPATSEALLITMHRIKGSAASIGLQRPAKLAHLAEDLLQELREHKQPITTSLAEALSSVADALRNYVKGLRENAADSSSFPAAAAGLLYHARGLAAVEQQPPSAAPANNGVIANNNPVSQPKASQTAFSWQPQIVEQLQRNFEHDACGWIGHVRFSPGLALAGMKAQLLFDKLIRIGTVSQTIPEARGLEDRDDLADFYFAIQTKIGEVDLRTQLSVNGVAEFHFLPLAHTTANSTKPAPVVAVAEVDVPAKIADKPVAEAAEKKAEVKQPSNQNGEHGRPNETLRVDIERLDQLMNLAGQLVINKARFSQIGSGMKDVLPSKDTANWLNNAAIVAERVVASIDANVHDASQLDLDTLRIQMRRLATDLTSLKEEFSRFNTLHSKVNDLNEAVHQLERVSGGIQKSVMDTRMVPIGPLFQRFKRVVRDVTRTNNKDVRLTIHGEKTELDKRMIDELGDPLIHMVRNSADHGVETTEARIAAGKSPQGEIILDAFHRGNSIVFQVRDDGKGLDQARILAKAIEREIITPADAERMTSHQIHQLIWEPGFSTAEKVTEISGRGMGMDIVRSKIEALSGTVEVDSVPGKGATFTIKLPLTLAILPSLMSVIDGDTFAIPLESIVEIVRVRKRDIATVHGLPAAQIRGRVVSVVELTDLVQWSQPSRVPHTESDDSTLVVIGHESREIGLVVDHVIGEDDIVIKSLAENYKNVPGIAGASILGDGCVSLILDVAALVDTASKAVLVATV
jgi:two-component system chemotaxis sensor kinase CheA